MAKKVKKTKDPKKSNNKSDKNKKEENSVLLKYNKITNINSFHTQNLIFCFLSITKKYIVTCSASYLLLLDPKNFQVLSKYKMTKPPNYLIELENQKILCVDTTQIFLFKVKNNFELNLIYYELKDDFDEMGVIGCSQTINGDILIIIPKCINYYRQSESKDKYLELYDKYKFEDFTEILFCDYGTQFKNSFNILNNNDYLCLLTSEELYIINHKNKKMIKKIIIEKSTVLLKYIILSNDYTLIYHKKKILLFSNKHLEIINNYLLSNETEEITCIEKLKNNNNLAYGTNLGKIYIYNYIQSVCILEISFDNQIFNIFWIKELDSNLIVNNMPKGKISFTNYSSGNKMGELVLKNSGNYRRGVFLEESNKLLLGCSKNFAIIE